MGPQQEFLGPKIGFLRHCFRFFKIKVVNNGSVALLAFILPTLFLDLLNCLDTHLVLFFWFSLPLTIAIASVTTGQQKTYAGRCDDDLTTVLCWL